MLLYATPADFNALGAADLSVPEINRLLGAASRLVRNATRAAIYDTDSAGKPSDPDILAAFVEATTLHARAMLDAGITNPAAGATAGAAATVSSASILGASITYGTGSAASGSTVTDDRAALLEALCPDALWALESAGVLPGVVQTW